MVGELTDGHSPSNIGLLGLLVGVYFSHVGDWGSRGNDSPLALRVLKPFRWALGASSTHDWYKKCLGLQKQSLERTSWGPFLDPSERVARYLRREQNLDSCLDSCRSWTDSYVDAPAIGPTEVSNRRKIAYCKRNARKVSVVLISKCPEPFAGVGYTRR